jgi:hypothetical protein
VHTLLLYLYVVFYSNGEIAIERSPEPRAWGDANLWILNLRLINVEVKFCWTGSMTGNKDLWRKCSKLQVDQYFYMAALRSSVPAAISWSGRMPTESRILLRTNAKGANASAGRVSGYVDLHRYSVMPPFPFSE